MCNRQVFIDYHVDYGSVKTVSAIQHTIKALTYPRSIIIFGVGLHDDLEYKTVQRLFLSSLARLMWWGAGPSDWHQTIWVTPHLPGSLKPPRYKKQNTRRVKDYTQQTKEYLNHFHIPSLVTHDLTHGIHSFDGTHYGFGLNSQVAQILLTYLEKSTRNIE